MKKTLALLPLLFFFNQLVTQSYVTSNWSYPVYVQSAWADSILASMTQEEKIGQLFMVAAYSNRNAAHERDIENLIRNQHIGGLIFMQGGPVRQANLTNRFQAAAKTPLLISMDAEWGLSMRLDSVMSFPRFMTVGAVQNDTLVYDMGVEIGKQLRRLGVHVNFSPVVDVNNNSANPVIHTRSFGEDKWEVARRSTLMMQGLQNQKVIAVAKHFPGHGDTNVDSHYDLPVINFSRERLDTLEMIPFKHLISKGVAGVMMAHLYIPSLDNTPNTPSSLSKKVTTQILKNEMGFSGLVFSDALNMKAVTKFYSPGNAEVHAFLAGNDILLFPEDVPKAAREIKAAVERGQISQKELDARVLKILQAKKWVGLDQYKPVEVNNLIADLNSKKAELNKQSIAEASITIVKDQENLLPVLNLSGKKIASVAIGPSSPNAFQQALGLYAPITHYQIPKNASLAEFNSLLAKLKDFDLVIAGVHEISRLNVRTFGLNDNLIGFVNNLALNQDAIIVAFGTPYVLKNFPKAPHIVLAYEDEAVFQRSAAQVIFGGLPSRGKLPVSATSYRSGQGIDQNNIIRLKYTLPEELGIPTASLRKSIDSIVNNGIARRAMPGAQVLIAKDGKVIFHEAYGHHTYEDSVPVRLQDIYDLASITKIAATTLVTMKLYEDGRLKLDDKIKKHVPELSRTDKGNITIRDLLTHQAGLQAWIPFYTSTVINKKAPCDSLYCVDPNDYYSVRVADHMFLNNEYEDYMWQIMNDSPLEKRPKYVYSDLSMFYLKRVIDNILVESFETYLYNYFYGPLGLATMTYNPTLKFPMRQIVPTERDNYFRFQLLRGHVHDPAAAMVGGVAGHAGLFSNANDLAILMQMLLNGGTYGGYDFLEAETIETFTKLQNRSSRRGLGFDKPEPDPSKTSPASRHASLATFGHLGFTGTVVWSDPEHNLTYIFLSNRVYPSQTNNLLTQLRIRTHLHTAAYEAFLPQVLAGGK